MAKGVYKRTKPPWNKGKTGVYSETSLKKMSIWQKGKHLSKEHRKNLSKNSARFWLGKHLSEETTRRMSLSAKGRKLSEETKRKLSEINKGKHIGEKNHFWRGGISYEPYSPEFNKELKEQIRKRDNYRCQECFRHQDELFKNTKAGMRPYKLHVHHIDYNKKNNQEDNLISLCIGCHLQTNYGREDWTEYYQDKL